MPRLPLALALLCILGWTSGCIDLPEVVDPPVESPADSGTEPPADAGTPPDAGERPDAGPVDTSRPVLRNTSPMGGATEVPTSAQLVLTFSESMDTDSVQVDVQPAVELGTPSWSLQDSVLSLQPIGALSQNVTYTVTVDGEDVAGNPLTGTRSFSFTTEGPAPDTSAPTVLATSPGQASIGNARSTLLEVVFSEPMDKASVQAAFSITAPGGFNTGSYSWNEAATVMTYSLPANLPYGADVTWQVSTSARDVAGNTLGETVSRSFRIIRQGTLTVSFDPATSGAVGSPDYFRQTHFYNGAHLGDDFADITYRLFLGFRLTSLPESLTRITQADLRWWVTTQHGDPFGKFGQLLLEPVNVGEQIELMVDQVNPETVADYHAPPLTAGIEVSPSAIGSPGNLDVTLQVERDWSERVARNRRTQYRLRFVQASDNDGSADSLYSAAEIHPTLAELRISYEYP